MFGMSWLSSSHDLSAMGSSTHVLGLICDKVLSAMGSSVCVSCAMESSTHVLVVMVVMETCFE